MKFKFFLKSLLNLKILIVLTLIILVTYTAYDYFKSKNLVCNNNQEPNLHTIYNLRSSCYCRDNSIYYSESQNDTYTCGLYNTYRRGRNQKIVSYSLYGKAENYYSDMKYLSKLVAKYYPEWIIRIYHDNSINKTIICEFECLKDETTGKYMDNIDFCNINEIPYGNPASTWNAQYMHAMTWRFMPIGDSFVDMFMSRDLDSWIVQREVDAVNVWVNSNTLFHVMRDHPQHVLPILGGMWGYANYRDREAAKKLFSILIDPEVGRKYNFMGNNEKGNDQAFLRDLYWEHAKKNGTIQDSFYCGSFGYKSEPFPSQRPKVNCYVACFPGCCDETISNKTWDHECPVQCRPSNHKDWTYC